MNDRLRGWRCFTPDQRGHGAPDTRCRIGCILLKSLNFAADCRPAGATKQFSCLTKPFSAFAQTSGNTAWLSIGQRKRRAAPAAKHGDSQMRTLSFFSCRRLVLAGPSIAGSLDGGLAGHRHLRLSRRADRCQAMVVAAREAQLN